MTQPDKLHKRRAGGIYEVGRNLAQFRNCW